MESPLFLQGALFLEICIITGVTKKMFCPCQADTLELSGYMNDYSKKKGGAESTTLSL